MADKKEQWVEPIRKAISSLTGKRVAEDLTYMTGGRAVQDVAERVAKRVKKRPVKNRDRQRE